ncbi:signal transduction histidine kinase [Thermoflavifilum aggregans]|uniref:histidine kinase n=1 Tax=Thermoflavifilum aggregans TaxID=454188 RepID=A0A2M9CSP5_9BACT|nr:HAMP domain-containing sensor histidine kinase [Thermoflavifilum aggregans]PJJ74913.1 signal transduction histidine kinase [Thermoflavifilum aggregans]
MHLLTRSTRTYVIYASIMMLVAIPLCYLLIHYLFIQDADEWLLHEKDMVVEQVQQHQFDFSVSHAPGWQTNVMIKPIQHPHEIRSDQFYTEYVRNPLNHEQVPYRVLSSVIASNGNYYQVLIRISLIDSEDLIQSLVLTIGMLWALLFIGWIMLSRIQSRRLWRPFYHTLEQLKQFQLNQHHALQLPEQETIQEFRELNQTLNHLTAHIVTTYQHEKEFTENMAHEMQTPLSIIQSQIDCLLQDKYLNAAHAEQLQHIHQAVRRLSRISKSLLLLTRIEHHQFEEIADIEFSGLIQKNLLLIEPLIEARGLQLHYQVHACPVVRMHPFLADVLISNLLSNAVRHNIESGDIEMDLMSDILCIRNTGIAQPLEDDIFNRYRTRSHPEQGNGLGLSIVREICRISGMHIHYHYAAPWHVFELHFQPVRIEDRITSQMVQE